MSEGELKKALLELLKRDEEFRLAVAGAIGLAEVLEELRRLRGDVKKLYEKSLEHDRRFEAIERKLLEHDKRFESIERKLLEHDKRFEAIERKLLEHDRRFEVIEKKLLEHDRRFEAIERKLLEHDKRFEAIERKLLEHDKRFEAIGKKLLEHDKRFEAIEKKLLEHDEKFHKVIEEIRNLNRRIAHVEDGIGALAEATLSWFTFNDIRGMLEEGERLEARLRNARVDGEDIDLLVVTDRRVFIIEVKVRPKHSDVGALLAKGEIVARRYPGRRVELVLAGTRIGGEVAEYARARGVLVLAY